jgi:hypothetical protein
MGGVGRVVLLCFALLVCAAVLFRAAASAPTRFVGHPEFHTVSSQLTFEAVTKVPRCADYYGTGTVPAEGHAAVFVRLSSSSMYFVGELSFDGDGWVADDLVLGDLVDSRHFTLYLYAVTSKDIQRLGQLPPGEPVAVRPMRLLDVITVVRDDGPDTC